MERRHRKMKKARVPMISTTGRQRSAWMAVPRHRANSAFLHAAAGIVMFAGGCALPRPDLFGLKDSARSPRIRLSCYASSTLGSVFTDADNLGTHHYDNGKGEKNGIIYTCKAGHIDLPQFAQLRVADRCHHSDCAGWSVSSPDRSCRS